MSHAPLLAAGLLIRHPCDTAGVSFFDLSEGNFGTGVSAESGGIWRI